MHAAVFNCQRTQSKTPFLTLGASWLQKNVFFSFNFSLCSCCAEVHQPGGQGKLQGGGKMGMDFPKSKGIR